MKQIKKILVCIDGSKCANEAADFAGEIALTFDAEVVLLHVYRPPETTRDLPAHGHRVEAERTLDMAKLMMNERGLRHKELVELDSNPANLILKESAKGYDLIVMGSRGLGAMEGYLFGSVTSKVVHHSKIPTLIIPCEGLKLE
jgi:nucleotide-binding universal stress UspA family protein